MNNYEAYLICKERGHQADPYKGSTAYAIVGAVPHYICKYCGTTFWTTTKTTQHESNAPTPSQQRSDA